MLRINNVRSTGLSAAGLFLTIVIAAGVLAGDARFAPAAAGWTDSGKYAAIVIDGNTDEVMFARNADAPRYPASLTKIMTLYLLFDELRHGRTTLDSKITFSKHSSAQPPSKLGIKPGGTITVKQAILALVTKSANDVAAAIGEHIAGSEAAFARKMTARARAIGMKSTTFRNASGLPDSEQKTTARDLAALARAIMDDFPEEYGYFKTRSFAYNGRYYRNHNRLLGRVSGVDGIKTGYINASGFNLTTSARRGEKHLIAVVMGGPTGRTRDNHMASLIERYFPRASLWPRIALPKVAPLPPRRDGGRTIAVAAAVPADTAPVPPMKPVVLTAEAAAAPQPKLVPVVAAPQRKPQPIADTAAVELASQDAVKAKIEDAAEDRPAVGDADIQVDVEVKTAAMTVLDTGSAEEEQGDADEDKADQDRVKMSPVLANAARDPIGSLLESETTLVRSNGPAQSSIAASEAPDPVAADRQVTTSIARKLSGDTWLIQIGAYDNEDAARERLQAAKEKSNLLNSRLGYTEPVDVKSATLYRARFAGFDRDDAQKACKALKRAKFGCLPLKQ